MSLLITTPKNVYVKYFKYVKYESLCIYEHCRYNTVVIKYTTTNITDWIVVVKGVSPSNNDSL